MLDPKAIELIEGWPLFDNAIVAHGFTSYMRDYDLVVEATAAGPSGVSYLEGRYRYRFTHCVVANVLTTVRPEVWAESWTDEYVDYEAWQRVGAPAGFVWGVEHADAYPGAGYVRDSPLARDWSERLKMAMHEVVVESNTCAIQLVFHGLGVLKVAEGDPTTRELRSIDPVRLM